MTEKKEKKLLGIIIILMIVTLVILCVLLVKGVERADRQYFSSSLVDFLTARRVRGPLPVSSADFVRSWMTFDYVNQLFGLPQEYLKKTLNITDSRYPNLSLSEYRESIATSSASFLETIRSTIFDFNPSSSSGQAQQ